MKLPIPHEFHRAAHRFSALWSGAAGTVAYGRRAAGSAVDTLDDPIYGRSLELAAEHSSDRKPVRCLHCGVPIRVWTDPATRSGGCIPARPAPSGAAAPTARSSTASTPPRPIRQRRRLPRTRVRRPRARRIRGPPRPTRQP